MEKNNNQELIILTPGEHYVQKTIYYKVKKLKNKMQMTDDFIQVKGYTIISAENTKITAKLPNNYMILSSEFIFINNTYISLVDNDYDQFGKILTSEQQEKIINQKRVECKKRIIH